MTERKILFFADKLPPLIGGMEVHAEYFVKYFKNSVVISKNDQNQDCIVIKNKKYPINLIQLKDLYKPDIVFFNSGRWIEELIAIKNMFSNVPFVYRTGGNEILKASLIENKINKHQHRQLFWVSVIDQTIDLMITNSTYTENRLRNLGMQVRFQKCVGGVDIELIKSIKFKKPEDFTIFCAARFVPYKNHHLIIDICKQLVDGGLKFKLRLAGDGSLLQEIKLKVQKENLNNITFLGVLSNQEVYQEIIDANLYLQLSSDYRMEVPGGYYIHSECMGRSILEALSAGTFVIASNSGALSELAINGRGVLVGLQDIYDICSKIMTLMESSHDKLEHQDCYSWNILFQNYEKIFEELNEDLACNRKT